MGDEKQIMQDTIIRKIMQKAFLLYGDHSKIDMSNQKISSHPQKRLKLVEFYNSKEGQELYSQRKISIEPLFEILKSTFNIRILSVKGFANVQSFVLICVLVYQLAVYYNCVTKVENPRIVKRMLCC